MSLEWSDDLAVGHPEIDAQHRSLFEQFGTLLEACGRQRGPEQLIELFGCLDGYVKEHFRVEETLMDEHGYPDGEAHRRQHRHFIDQLAGLRHELVAAGPTLQVLIRTNKALI
jgi:hemerythrin